MGGKQAALGRLRAELARWEALIGGMDEAQLTAPLAPSHWSIKDVLAHLRAWQQRSIARLEAALAGGEPEFPRWPEDFDPEAEGQPHDLNAWLYERAREQPWPSVHREWRDGFLRLVALADALPEEALLEAGRYPWLEGYSLAYIIEASCEHHDEHMQLVQASLQGE